MAKVANLNHFRKQQARVVAKARADENAVRNGRSKQANEQEAAQAAKARRDLDGHKRDP